MSMLCMVLGVGEDGSNMENVDLTLLQEISKR